MGSSGILKVLELILVKRLIQSAELDQLFVRTPLFYAVLCDHNDLVRILDGG